MACSGQYWPELDYSVNGYPVDTSKSDGSWPDWNRMVQLPNTRSDPSCDHDNPFSISLSLVSMKAGSSQSSARDEVCVTDPRNPVAVLRRLMGVLPSVIRVDFSPRDCSSRT